MSSKFFTYSARANPLILLFLGILGVLWGSTIFLGILICVSLYFALHDTSLTPEESHILNMKGISMTTTTYVSGTHTETIKESIVAPRAQHRSAWKDDPHVGQAIGMFITGIILTAILWIFGFIIVMIWSLYSLLRYLSILQKDLKTEIARTTHQ